MKHFLTVFNGIYAPAVNAPGVAGASCAKRGCTLHTSDWREAPGTPGNTHRVEAVGQRVDLVEAITRTWDYDAHALAWTVTSVDPVPRVAKARVAWFAEQIGEEPRASVLSADVDNPEHRDWTDEDRDAFEATWATCPMLSDAGVFLTRGGWRIVQPLERALPVAEFEAVLWRWLLDLKAAGVVVDRSCRDWTRLFRLARVLRENPKTRKKTPFHGEVRIERMREIPVPSVPVLVARAPSRTAAKARAPVDVETVAAVERAVVADAHRAGVDAVAAAVRDVATEWHELFLAVAGALLEVGVEPEYVPALCGSISDATGADTRRDDRVTAGRSTVARWLSRQRVAGLGTLDALWPAVGRAVRAAFARGDVAAFAADDTPAPPPGLPVREAVEALESVLREARDEVVCVRAPCGLGKTHSAQVIAAERSAREHADPESESTRAPRGSKTAISVDKNDLAIQVAADLAAQGVGVKRFFGPLSLKRADGTRECKFFDAARHLAGGGQSVVREFCEGRGRAPCPHKATCRAWRGVEGPDDARVAVGPHQLLGALDGFAGTSGLLVVDEPPALVEGATIPAGDFDAALIALGSFEDSYAKAMRPLLQAVSAWVREIAPEGDLHTLTTAVEGAVDAIDADDLRSALEALGEDPGGGTSGDTLKAARGALAGRETATPPIQWSAMARARASAALAQVLGSASRVCGLLYRAATSEAPVAFRVEGGAKGRVCVVSQVREAFVGALKRDGAVVVTDANVDLHVPLIARVVGYEPRVLDLVVADGAPVARTLLRRSGANRAGWFAHGRLVVSDELVRAVRAAFAWACEGPAQTLGVITFRPLRLALEAAYSGPSAALAAAWREAGQTPETLAAAVEALKPCVDAWRGEGRVLLLGHYQALRGLNLMADADALVTLGDPWPNLGDVRHACAVLGIEEWEERFEAMARAELEQAHGRLRTVHRARPGRACHVGTLLPSGASWHPSAVDVRVSRGGRPKGKSAMTPDEARALRAQTGWSRSRLAYELNCSPETVKAYEDGARPVNAALAALLRQVAAARSRLTPVSA